MKADPWENAEFQGISLETLWIASFYQLDIGSIHLPCDNIWFRIHKSTQRPVRLFSVSYTSGKPCTCKKNQTDKQQQKKTPTKTKNFVFWFWLLFGLSTTCSEERDTHFSVAFQGSISCQRISGPALNDPQLTWVNFSFLTLFSP